MINELVAHVSERTGIPSDKARAVVDTIIAKLKAHLPPAMANHIDGVLAGTIPTTGVLGDAINTAEQRASAALGSVEQKVQDRLGTTRP